MQRILRVFFILLFSFQIAPVQQVGSFLYCNQLTEEIPHNPDDSGMKNPDDSLKHLYYLLFDHGHNEPDPGYFLTGKAVDVIVKTRSSDDIQTQPPNPSV